MVHLEINDNRDLSREMRALAAGIAVDGRKALALSRKTEKYIQNLPARMVRSDMAALDRLAQAVHLLQQCARRARIDGGMRLPSCGGTPRIYIVAEYIVSGGDNCPSANDVQKALTAFDAAQSLTVKEYMAVPEALRICLCEAAANTARKLLSDADEHIAVKNIGECVVFYKDYIESVCS